MINCRHSIAVKVMYGWSTLFNAVVPNRSDIRRSSKINQLLLDKYTDSPLTTSFILVIFFRLIYETHQNGSFMPTWRRAVISAEPLTQTEPSVTATAETVARQNLIITRGQSRSRCLNREATHCDRSGIKRFASNEMTAPRS